MAKSQAKSVGLSLVAVDGDFRQRSAQRRRDRMRERLLEATMTVCSERGTQNVALQDILDAAEVSRGTFYSHYDSLHDAVGTVARMLVDDAQATGLAMYKGVTDPLLRVAVGPQLFLTRAALQPAWASIIVESGELLTRSTFVSAIRRDILANMRKKTFRRTDVQVAVDLHVGAMMQGSRTLLRRAHGKREYIRTVDFNLLLAFGVPESTALDAVDRAAKDLQERAPGILPWWRELN